MSSHTAFGGMGMGMGMGIEDHVQRTTTLALPPIAWSTLGVVADGSDQTAHLNAMCSFGGGNYCGGSQVIYCDTGNNTVLLAGQWTLQSGELLELNNCPIQATINTTKNASVFTQANVKVPISNVVIDQLKIDRISTANVNRMFYIWYDHFGLTNSSFDHYSEFGLWRGSDVEIGNNIGTNCLQTTGHPAFRWVTNFPKQPSSGKPVIDGVLANVYIHDNNVCTGDAGYQISPGGSLNATWGGRQDSDGIVFQHNKANTTSGALGLVGTGNDRTDNPFIYTITNFVFDDLSGSAGNVGFFVDESDQGVITGGLVKNLNVDSINDANGTASVFTLDEGANCALSGTVFDGLVIKNPYQVGLRIDEGSCGVIVKNFNIGAPRITPADTIELRGDTGTVLMNGTAAAEAGAHGIFIGPNSYQTQSPTLSNVSVTGVPNLKVGIFLNNVDGAMVSGGAITPAPGQTTAIGAKFSPAGTGAGTTNSQMTGVNLTAPGTPLVFNCNGGTTNSAIGNPGAADHRCP